MALLSPGIQLFETSTTPAAVTTAAGNGIATLGFSSRGPINKLVKLNSIAEFNEIFGEPVGSNYYSHILTESVLALGQEYDTGVYFMRVADPTTVKYAKCPVIDFDIKGAKIAIKDKVSTKYTGYFMTFWDKEGTIVKPTKPALKISITGDNFSGESITELKVSQNFGPAGDLSGHDYVLWIPISDVVDNLNEKFKTDFKFIEVDNPGKTVEESEVGIIISATNETRFANSPLVVTVEVGEYNKDTEELISSPSVDTNTIPEVLDGTGEKKTFDGEELRNESTLGEYKGISKCSRFELTAKSPGSSMDNFRITKKTTVSSVDEDEKTWTISVYDGESATALESKTFAATNKPAEFYNMMKEFSYIDVEGETALPGDGKDEWTWDYDGTWILSRGKLLSNGECWDGDPAESEDTYIAQGGDNGYPMDSFDGKEQYSEYQGNNIYKEALKNPDFVNVDEINFSILAIPGSQNIGVQNAAINVCATRGDAIFIADVPEDLCGSRDEIDEAVKWSNSNSGFQSSYCAIYYGWFAQNNPYESDSSIICPASCFVVPKMVVVDSRYGEFFAPAGVTRGTIVCSDWLYSPDQNDRDKLVGNDNVINPISYSNTRGVTIMAQKTTDRTTSPLNRVGVRRMTNMIKRNLRSRLVSLLFEPNNEVARSNARNIVDNILSGLRTRNCIETYDINVVSGTGANRNDLNVYLSFAPYGLIEKIYVYLSITDAGVEVTEAVA